jgi:hypothetical protein
VVIEIPPADSGSINGTIMDVWQMPLEDVGPAGADKGNGGRYLVLPPDYQEKAPAGYIVLPLSTYQGYALLRSILRSGSDEDVAKAVAYGRRVKVYPLSQAQSPSSTQFVDASYVVYDATIPYDLRFFQSLNRVVQYEPWLARDKAMIDPLKSIGIERGAHFNPNPKTEAILGAAAREAKALLESRYEGLFAQPYFNISRWAMPASPAYLKAAPGGYTEPDNYPVADHGILFSFAFFTPKHVGEGQYYLMTIKDAEGRNLSGGNTYRLTVPANAPVKLYWSATVYDRADHALIRDQKWSSRSSQTPGLHLRHPLEGDLARLVGSGIPVHECAFPELLVHFVDGADELCVLGLVEQIRLMLLLGCQAGEGDAYAQRFQIWHLLPYVLQHMEQHSGVLRLGEAALVGPGFAITTERLHLDN